MSVGTLLLLEDSRAQNMIISRMVETFNWSIMISFNHVEALSILKTTYCDLMLLDVFIDNVSTLDCLDKFRSIRSNVPVAIMSAG